MDELGRARAGTWVAFFVTGLVAATWASRIPDVARRLELAPGDLALVVLGIEGGAVAGLAVGASLVARCGSRWSLRAGLAVYAPALLAAPLAPGLAPLTVGLGVWGAANSVVDVALNAQGVELNRRFARPVLSGLHAAQGIGLLVGAATAVVAAGSGLPLLIHCSVVAFIALAFGLSATAPLLQERTIRSTYGLRARPSKPLLRLGMIAFCAFLIDGAANSWVAVQLGTDYDADADAAAAGYLVFTGAVVLGRLVGDRLTIRFSRAGTVRASGLGAAAGTALAVLAPSLNLALMGWAVVGLAVAPLIPNVIGAAADVRGLPAPIAIAAVTTIGYLGSFTGPPLIGLLAEVTGFSAALALLAVAGLTVAVQARHLQSTPHAGSPVGASDLPRGKPDGGAARG